jgi:hypothetical protein
MSMRESSRAPPGAMRHDASMEIAPESAALSSPLCSLRAQRVGRVKFVGLPLDIEPAVAPRGQRLPGAMARFLSRVIGCLAAARP